MRAYKVRYRTQDDLVCACSPAFKRSNEDGLKLFGMAERSFPFSKDWVPLLLGKKAF